MNCQKCCAGSMYLDSDRQASIEVHACSMCGNRVYAGYYKRRGRKAQEKWEADNLQKHRPVNGRAEHDSLSEAFARRRGSDKAQRISYGSRVGV